MNDSAPDPTRKIRIAVITVHGVADQLPEDTANTAANLLLHLDAEGSPPPPPRYSGFKTHRLRIANRPVQLNPKEPNFGGPDESEKCQHQFLRGQLKHYKEPDPSATYQTIRNEGVRRDPTGSEHEVHIYEMYWADLSRLGNSFLTFFVELYQLLFHLCTVAAKTARFAAVQHPTWAWKRFSGSIHLASHFIRLPIPIGNLFVLALVALAASAQIPEGSPLIRTIVIAVACLGAGAAVAFGLRKIVAACLWPYVLIFVVLLVVGLWCIIAPNMTSSGGACLLHVEVWAVLLFLLWEVLKAYDKRHPGAREWGLGIGLVASALLGFAIWRDPNVVAACTFSGKILLRGLGLFWTFTIFAAAFAWLIGIIAIKGTDAAARPRAHRAVFTANLVTAMTGFVMLVINISLWGLVALLLRKVPDKYDAVIALGKSITEHLTTETILPGMTTLLILMAAGSLWAVWSLLPTVRSEIQTPPPESKSSEWIGQSLTNAFRVMTWSGYIAIGCFSFLFVIAIILHGVAKDPIGFLVTWDKAKAATIFGSFSGVILLFLIAPFFMKGAIVKLSAGFRQGLDIALDVINYLRENPTDYTIRAQIFARYVSLLRHVCNWKSPIDGDGYDRIVIFAHSQGTIITVDLLRFLKMEPDPDLKSLAESDRIQLFTMGCPLRQLYGLRFPHLYGWARHSGGARPDKDLPADQPPDPKGLLSVDQWVNAYRSGDYVGRNLWRSEEDKDVYALNVAVHDRAKIRREFCVGGGAHIHYWDKTAANIVEELDRLISAP